MFLGAKLSGLPFFGTPNATHRPPPNKKARGRIVKLTHVGYTWQVCQGLLPTICKAAMVRHDVSVICSNSEAYCLKA